MPRQLPIKFAVIATLGVVAACAPKPAPPPPPPPRIVIPPKPYPPMGAVPGLITPARNAMGQRVTVNTGLSSAQTTWNLRSAFNVAALNCMQPQHAAILPAYRAYLKDHARTLGAANLSVDREFKAKYGARFIPPRETYMTQVYNYFAFPPTLPRLCDAVLAMSQQMAGLKSADLGAFSATQLPAIDRIYHDFYDSYDRYSVELAAWEAKYGPPRAVVPGNAPTVTTAPPPVVVMPTPAPAARP